MACRKWMWNGNGDLRNWGHCSNLLERLYPTLPAHSCVFFPKGSSTIILHVTRSCNLLFEINHPGFSRENPAYIYNPQKSNQISTRMWYFPYFSHTFFVVIPPPKKWMTSEVSLRSLRWPQLLTDFPPRWRDHKMRVAAIPLLFATVRAPAGADKAEVNKRLQRSSKIWVELRE